MRHFLTYLCLVVAVVSADRSIAVVKELYRVVAIAPNKFVVSDVISAQTFVPSLRPSRDDWLATVEELSRGAQRQPNLHFWNLFRNEQQSVAFDVTDRMYHRLTRNVQDWKYECELHARENVIGEAKFAVEGMSVYNHFGYLMKVLPQAPKLVKIDGYGSLENPNVSIRSCRKLHGDAKISLQRRLYPFHHRSHEENSIRVSIDGVVQANDLLVEKVDPRNDNLLNVAAKLNRGAKVEMTINKWKPFNHNAPVGMYIPRELLDGIYENRLDFQYRCHFRIPVEDWTSASYSIEAMEIFKGRESFMNVVDQLPTVEVVTATGQKHFPKAQTLGCEGLPIWRGKQLLSRVKADATGADEVDVALICRDEECLKKAEDAQNQLEQQPQTPNKQAQAAIEKVAQTTDKQQGSAASICQVTTLVLGLVIALNFF